MEKDRLGSVLGNSPLASSEIVDHELREEKNKPSKQKY